jgi:superfamily II DNA helicase RecQ
LNIASCKFTVSVPKELQKVQLENFSSFKIILTTPEMIEGDLLNKMETTKIQRVVFDEAHIMLSWGNTFRPLYKTVTEQVSRLDCPKLLLSATVPKNCLQELESLFGNLIVIRDSVFRDNLIGS